MISDFNQQFEISKSAEYEDVGLGPDLSEYAIKDSDKFAVRKLLRNVGKFSEPALKPTEFVAQMELENLSRNVVNKNTSGLSLELA